MKFESRKYASFNLFAIACLVLLITIVVYILMSDFSWINVLVFILMLSVIGLLLWIFFDTSYKLKEEQLYYKSGPFKGNISINNFDEIIKGKTMWTRLKPATAKKGFTIKYDKLHEIYVSPKTNDLFISELLKINSGIRITE